MTLICHAPFRPWESSVLAWLARANPTSSTESPIPYPLPFMLFYDRTFLQFLHPSQPHLVNFHLTGLPWFEQHDATGSVPISGECMPACVHTSCTVYFHLDICDLLGSSQGHSRTTEDFHQHFHMWRICFDGSFVSRSPPLSSRLFLYLHSAGRRQSRISTALCQIKHTSLGGI